MINVFLQEHLDSLEQKGLRRSLRLVEGSQGREIIVDGKKVLNFCSNNYLGLADDKRLIAAAAECMEKEGFGAGASRLVCGHFSAHQKLEETLARFKGTERALLFNSGYTANVGIISSVFDHNDIIFCDKFNHASIIDGILLSRAAFKRFPHKDMATLEKMLKSSSGYKKKAIITDTVFSMDGDIAPLNDIVDLAKKYDCLIMVDEAHALGVLGKNGKGAVEHFGLEGKIDIQMGTLSKAVGSFGAYCCGPAVLIDFLINKARSFIYTTAVPACVAAAAQCGIEIIEKEPDRREQLWKNTKYLHAALKKQGFNILETQTPIIPLLIGDSRRAVEFSRRLFEAGILVSAIRPPTVPPNTSRLRVTVMATHTDGDMKFFVDKLTSIGTEFKII